MIYFVLKFAISGKGGIHIRIKFSKPAIAAMHGPHGVFDIGQCTVIHCDAGGVSWLTNEKQRKTDIRLRW